MNVLVTGATGLVGSHLVEALAERGDRVWALVRNPERAEFLKPFGAQIVRGDLLDPRSLEEALQASIPLDLEVVYHCAARVALPYQGDRRELFRTNVEGTRHILDLCVHSLSVERFVFVSSVAVYGDVNEALIREDHPLRPMGPYAESKAAAEELVRRYAQQGLEVAILRPCVIYGPRDRNFLPQILETLPGKPFPLVSGGRQPLDMVYATDVAQALILAGTRPEAAGQTYNVTDGELHTLREVVEAFRRVSGLPLRTLSVPYPVAWGLAALSYAWSKLRHPGEDPLLAPSGVRAMARPHHYDISKVQRELGYEPRVKLEEGLKRAVDWYFQWKEGTKTEEEEAGAAYGSVREM